MAAATVVVDRYKAKVDADTQARAKQAEQAAEQQVQETMRKTAVAELEKSIKKTAIEAVNSGVLTGPIIRVSCNPATSADATDTQQATFSCMAVNKVNASDGTEDGYA